jgi:hypothetical protein
MEIEQTSIVNGEVVVLQTAKNEKYFAYTPSIPGCNSEGRTKFEALDNIRNAIREFQMHGATSLNGMIEIV